MIRTTAAAATVLAAALAGGTAGPAPAAVAAPGGELRVFTLEPGSLLPAGATDPAAGLLARQLYRGLVSYQPDGTPVLELAESIESSNQQLWTVEVRPGYAFHDGVPVDAAAFVRGWEHARTGPHAPLFDQIVDVVAEDNQTLTIELAEPAVSFPARLGHPAFSPLAQACLDNLAACEQEPIGNGPYRIVGSWQPGAGAVLERFEDYPDPGQAQPDTLRFQVYPSVAAGCDAFLNGALDVLHPVTAPCRPDPVFPPGVGYFSAPGNAVNQLALPGYLPELADPRVRRALSLAVDWQAVVDLAFDGRLPLAGRLAGPHVAGWRPGACDDCRYDPDGALALLEEAGGWPGGELALWAPAGSGHGTWLAEVGRQLQANLGIDYTLELDLPLPDYLATAEAGGFTGPFWWSWDPAWPVLDAYLAPQFATGGPANHTGYSNPEVDALLAGGGAAGDLPGAVAAFQEAEDRILADLPVIPTWLSLWEAAYSSNVDQLAWNLFTGPDYGRTTLERRSWSP